ncbi:oxaloacetate decarboxylase [Saccharopolyspora spinosa]|uniref:isocitrate lyase/PEP mutase family protein n=1 Tax=Saccharopolyspora spinosa TaxID=60894 RepID=UPI003747D721
MLTTGLGIAATLGLPDLELYTATDNLQAVTRIADAVDVPVIADMDNGYGGPVNVHRTTTLFEHAGVEAVVLEDQRSPKTCPFYEGATVELESVGPAANKVRAAAEARRSDLLVIARTDASDPAEIRERATAYAAAGADLVMPNAPGPDFGLDDWAALRSSVGVPLVACVMPGSRAEREWDDDTLADAGISVVVDAIYGLLAAAHATRQVFTRMREDGLRATELPPLMAHHELGEAMGDGAVHALQKRYLT